MTKRTYKASGIGRKALLTSAFFLALTALAPLPAQAQKNTQQSSDAPTQAVPKDITTRAKLHTELASLYFQNGNLIVALEELTLAIAINPDYAPAYALRGVVLYHIKEFPTAESDFQKAQKLNARDPEINNNYGWYLCQTGKEKESIDYFLKAIRDPLYQTPEIAHLNAGACHIKLGELDQAEEYLRRTLRFSPGDLQAQYHLAVIGYKRSNFDAARMYLMEVIKNMPEPTPEVLWLLLRVERKLGDKTAEDSLAARLRRKFPDSPEYQELMKGNFE